MEIKGDTMELHELFILPEIKGDTMEQLHELFILPTGHKRCTGCSEIMLSLTDDHTLLCSDGFLSEISSELLPKDFDPDTLPDGLCPDCEAFSNE